jgi:LuxR family transcriptional regulator, maltose regulon positive regulatory protein
VTQKRPARRRLAATPTPPDTDLQRDRRVVRGVGFIPVEGKLHVAPAADGIILRGNLVDRLRESKDVPVILITGPPGYGKTTLLRQWEREDERPFAWLSLDEGDNDPATLLTYLLLALQRVEPLDAGIIAIGDDGQTVSKVTLPRLGRILKDRQRPFVIALDEAQALTSPRALKVLGFIADNMPAGSQLAMVARQAPDLPWSHLRTQRRLLEIETEDLKLTSAEAAALLEAAGVNAGAADVAALLDHTEGWAAGLYLAALMLRTESDRSRKTIEEFTGADNIVADYLRDELLAQLSPEEQTFLIRASLLDSINGPLCDDVLETRDSGAMLTHLARANLFIVALDRQDNWYRFHHLFVEMLRAELQRREPEKVQPLHSRASRWLEHNGTIDKAIEHARAAGEVERAAGLLWAQVPAALANGRRAYVEHHLDAFTNAETMRHARLALAAAWCAVDRGRPADHWIAAAERGVYDATRRGETESVTAAVTLLRATLARNGAVQMGADARLAARLQAPEDPWRCLADYLEAVSVLLIGNREEGRAKLEETACLSDALDVAPLRALTKAQLAALVIEDNDWDQAATLIASAEEIVAKHDLGESPAMSIVSCLSTLLAAKQGRADEARTKARRSMQMIALADNIAPWQAVQTRYQLARAHLILGGSTAARILLSEAQNNLTLTPDAVALRTRLDDAWQQVERSPVSLNGGLSTLTTAELRVLQLLPTHLSFEQIGARLFISRNTVKTQAISAYRKLGVTSRTEAVERAEALGMLQSAVGDGYVTPA